MLQLELVDGWPERRASLHTSVYLSVRWPVVSLKHAIECKEVSIAGCVSYLLLQSVNFLRDWLPDRKKSYDFYAGFYANSCHIYHAIQEEPSLLLTM